MRDEMIFIINRDSWPTYLYSWKDCIVEKEKPDASFMWR